MYFTVPGAFYEILHLSSLQLFSRTLHIRSAPPWPASACLLEGLVGLWDLSFSHVTLLMSFCSMLTSLQLPLRDSSHNAIVSCWGQPNTHLEIFKNIYRSLAAAKTATLAFDVPAASSVLWIVIHNAKKKPLGHPNCFRRSQTHMQVYTPTHMMPNRFDDTHSPTMLNICFKTTKASFKDEQWDSRGCCKFCLPDPWTEACEKSKSTAVRACREGQKFLLQD